MGKTVFNDKQCININKTILKCQKYKYISFDIFDTLVKRNVKKPKDIFMLLDNRAVKYGIKNFGENRMKTAAELFKNNPFSTLNDIYQKLQKIYDSPFIDELKQYEIELEISYCQPNYDVKRIYDYCKKTGKKICAISDMYLPKNVIERILIQSGYDISELYVSCECMAQKKDGTLFKHFLKDKKIKPNMLLHIGDNFRADYIGAKKAMIKSIYVTKKTNRFNCNKFYNKLLDKEKYETYLSIINNNISEYESYYSKFGFAYLGPLVYNYCLWLNEKCSEQNIKNIFFFARDGFVLKKAFDSIYSKKFNTHYIYVSRRAIRIPYASVYSTYDEVIAFFPESKMLTIKVFFENLGLEAEKYKELIKKYGFKIDDNVYFHELKSDERFKKIFEEVYDEFIANCKYECEILKKYFKQEHFIGKSAIVDVGWHNSMQFYIEDLFKNEQLDLTGLYVGFQRNLKKVKDAHAFIRDNSDEMYADSSLGFIGLIESVFLANEGSTKTYRTSKEKVVPVLFDYEYKKSDIEYNAFVEIQNGIYDFVKMANNLLDFEFYSLGGYDSYLPLKTYGINPYMDDIKYFENFRYFSEEIVYFAKMRTFVEYALNPSLIIADLYKSRWKIGFMKKLMRVPLPYYRIYRKLRGEKK